MDRITVVLSANANISNKTKAVVFGKVNLPRRSGSNFDPVTFLNIKYVYITKIWIIINNNNCLKSNIQCIEIQVQ